MVSVKPTVPHPNANYPGQPHEEMKRLVTEKYSPTDANQVIDAWGQLGTKFKELATDFSILVNGSQAGWTGQAAEAVRGALGKVGTFADTTGEGFTRTSSAIAQQRDAAVQANKAMPDPVDFNPLDIAKRWAGASIIFPPAMVASPVEMFMKHNEQQEAKAEAVQVMQTRDNTMMSAAMSMPAMESTPQVTQDQGITQPSSTTTSHSLSNVNANQRFSNNGMPNVPATTPPGTNNGTTNPSWVAPPTSQPAIPPGGNPNNPPGGQNRPPFTPPGVLPPGMRPPGGGQGRPPGGGQGVRGGGPGGASGRGGGAGGRGMGPGGMAGVGGSGRTAGSFGPSNPGGSAGVMGNGPGGAGTGSGAAGRSGAAGAGGAGAGGAGKGGEEDKEHKSNYLIPTDEFFDDDRMVAPPVIGG